MENTQSDLSGPLQSLERVLLNELKQNQSLERVAIAFSGGLDSKSLLTAANNLYKARQITNLRAFHVNHGLQIESHGWLEKCQRDCHRLGIELACVSLELAEIAHSNIEQAARDARYQFFEQQLYDNEVLLFAHHQEDQAETLVFRLLRGSGLLGASAMPKSRKLGKGRLLRPWLNVPRQAIQEYASQQNIDWIEDPSNQSDRYSRNYLRLNILPAIAKKWPGYAKTLSRFSQQATEQSELLAEIAEQDLGQLTNENSTLNIELLVSLSLARQKNVVRHWARQLQQNSPSSSELSELFNQLGAAKEKSICIDFAGGKLRSYRGALIMGLKQEPEIIVPVKWEDINQNIVLSNGLILDFTELKSMGLRKPKSDEVVLIKPRIGGEKCCPGYRSKSTDLKSIYQELSVPPWEREWLPLVYFNDELVAVPGKFIAKKFMT
ncbi:MAG: tRNA lysidine(34) synthetase TilS [Kangiellaceae bacterium]|nr:tRNA lysidine(34) synthetase TilS [Kangiellaceae bacterium]MCW8997767.1 tRNA lysidine(34) synthetase TilS [Kangiellaceae bacterium]